MVGYRTPIVEVPDHLAPYVQMAIESWTRDFDSNWKWTCVREVFVYSDFPEEAEVYVHKLFPIPKLAIRRMACGGL